MENEEVVYEWKPSKKSKRFETIAWLNVGLFFLSLFTGIYFNIPSFAFISIASLVFEFVCLFLFAFKFNVERDDYTRGFIERVENKLEEAKTSKALKELRIYLSEQAYNWFELEGDKQRGVCRLSFASDIKELHGRVYAAYKTAIKIEEQPTVGRKELYTIARELKLEPEVAVEFLKQVKEKNLKIN